MAVRRPLAARHRAAAFLRLSWWLHGLLPWLAGAISREFRLPLLNDVWTFLAEDVGWVGLASGAVVKLDLTNVRPANDTYVMMITHSQWSGWRRVLLPGADGSVDVVSSYLASCWRKCISDRINVDFKITAPHNDLYRIGVLNPHQQPLQLKGSLSLVNPGGNQLPLQERHVPLVLLATAGLFAISFGLFALCLASVWRHGWHAMHVLMTLVLFFKSAVLLLEWKYRMEIVHSGTGSAFSGVGWQLLDKVQTILELMMFLLVSLGWKFLRPTLNITEVRFALGISMISFYLGVFQVACTTESTCNGYNLSRYILHSLCYLVVIVAMNFNLQMVGGQIANAPATLESGKLYQKHSAYRIFRWIFLVFIIAPTVELFLKVSMMPWDAIWAYTLLQNLRTWSIYLCVLVSFRPQPSSLRVFELTERDDVSDDEGFEGRGGEARAREAVGFM